MPVYNIQVTVDSKGAVTGLKTVEVQAEKTGRKMSAAQKRAAALQARLNALARTAAIVGGAMIAMFARKAIQVATEQERVMALVESQIKATGQAAGLTGRQIFDMASDIQKATGIGDEEILASSAVLLSFKQIAGEVFKDTTRVAIDMAQVMGTDLRSATLQLAKALADPVARLGELSRAGIVFSDAQKQLIKEMVESGKLMEAQNFILAEIESQYGGAAAAARDTLGGALRALGSEWGDLLEMFVLEGGGGGALRTAVEAWVRLLQSAKENFRLLGVAWNNTIATILEALAKATSAIAAFLRFSRFMPGVTKDHADAAKDLSRTMADMASVFRDKANKALDDHVDTLRGVGDAAADAGKNVGALTDKTNQLSEAQKKAAEEARKMIDALDDARLRQVVDTYEEIARGLDNLKPKLMDVASIDLTEGLQPPSMEEAGFGDKGFWTKFRESFTGGAGARAMDDLSGQLASALAGSLATALTMALNGQDWESIGSAVGGTIGTVIGAAMGGPAGAAAGGAIGSLVGGLFGSLFDDDSAEKAKAAAEAFDKLNQAVRSSMPAIRQEIIKTVEAILEMLRLVQEAGQATGEEVQAISREIQGALDRITGVSPQEFGARILAAKELMDTLLAGTEQMADLPAEIIAQLEAIDLGQIAQNIVAEFMGITSHLSLATIQREAQDLRNAISQLGLSAEETARRIREVTQAEKMRVQELKLGVLDRFVSVLERAGINSAKAAQMRAEIEQKIFLISLKKLEAELRMLDLMDKTMRKLLNDVAAWAGNVSNFLPDLGGVGAVAPPPRMRGGGRRGQRKQKRKALRDTLQRFIDSGRMNDLNFQMEKLRKQFFGRGGFLDQAKKLGIPIRKVTQAFAAAVKQLREQALAGVRNLLDQIRGGALGGMSLRERLAAARSRYESILSRARAGDLNAFRDLPSAAQEFLALAREMYGSGSAYQEILQGVQQALQGLINEDELTKTDAQRHAEQISGSVDAQTEILADLGAAQDQKLLAMDRKMRNQNRLLEDIRDELRRTA